MECSRTRWFGQVLEDFSKRGRSWQEIERQDCGKKDDFSSFSLYGIEMTEEDTN